MSLAGRRALVTGAARGIGRATAETLAAAGAAVLCADRLDCGQTVAAIHAAGGEAHAACFDAADERSVLALFREVVDPHGALHCLVHCAGVIHEAPLLETTAEAFDHVVAVNLRGSFLAGREALRRMTGRGGRLVMLSSDLGLLGRETFSPYCASKAGVLGLVKSWAREFAPAVTVNAICPGPVDTAMLDASHMSAEWRARELAIPAARFARPAEVAALAAYLCGEQAGFVTGQAIGINGGSVMP